MKPGISNVTAINFEPIQLEDDPFFGFQQGLRHARFCGLYITSSILVLLAAILPQPLSAQSSIVIFWSPTEITIGADSKLIFGIDQRSGSACKIVQAGPYFFSAAGLHSDPKTGFSTEAIFRKTVSHHHRGMRQLVETFISTVISPLTRAINRIRIEEPKTYAVRFTPGAAALQSAFLGFEQGRPTLYMVFFKLQELASGRTTVTPMRQVCPGEVGCEPSILFVMGVDDAIKSFVTSNPNFWRAGGPVIATQTLIQLQIQATPDRVGPPIDILQINTNGAEWIQKKRECPEIKPATVD